MKRTDKGATSSDISKEAAALAKACCRKTSRIAALRRINDLTGNKTYCQPLLDALDLAIKIDTKSRKKTTLVELLAASVEGALIGASNLFAQEINRRLIPADLEKPLQLHSRGALSCFWNAIRSYNVLLTPIEVTNPQLSFEFIELAEGKMESKLQQLTLAAYNIKGLAALFENAGTEFLKKVMAACGAGQQSLTAMIDQTLAGRTPKTAESQAPGISFDEIDSQVERVRWIALESLAVRVDPDAIAVVGAELARRCRLGRTLTDCIAIGSSALLEKLAPHYQRDYKQQHVYLTVGRIDGLTISNDQQLAALNSAYQLGFIVKPVKFYPGYSSKEFIISQLTAGPSKETLEEFLGYYRQQFDHLSKTELTEIAAALESHQLHDFAAILRAIIEKRWPAEQSPVLACGHDRLTVISLDSGGHTVVDQRNGRSCQVALHGPDGLAKTIDQLEFELAAHKAVLVAATR